MAVKQNNNADFVDSESKENTAGKQNRKERPSKVKAAQKLIQQTANESNRQAANNSETKSDKFFGAKWLCEQTGESDIGRKVCGQQKQSCITEWQTGQSLLNPAGKYVDDDENRVTYRLDEDEYTWQLLENADGLYVEAVADAVIEIAREIQPFEDLPKYMPKLCKSEGDMVNMLREYGVFEEILEEHKIQYSEREHVSSDSTKYKQRDGSEHDVIIDDVQTESDLLCVTQTGEKTICTFEAKNANLDSFNVSQLYRHLLEVIEKAKEHTVLGVCFPAKKYRVFTIMKRDAFTISIFECKWEDENIINSAHFTKEWRVKFKFKNKEQEQLHYQEQRRQKELKKQKDAIRKARKERKRLRKKNH